MGKKKDKAERKRLEAELAAAEAALAQRIERLPEDVIARICEPPPPEYGDRGPRFRAAQVLMDPADHYRLRRLSLATGISLQQLGRAAWNVLLADLGLPEIQRISWAAPPEGEDAAWKHGASERENPVSGEPTGSPI